MEFIRHIPDTLTKVVHGMISKWKIFKLIVKLIGSKEMHQKEHHCLWVDRCLVLLFLHGVKVYKSSVWEKSSNVKGMFKKTWAFILFK